MHRGLLHTFAWTLATGAAVTLSWWGVHTVMSGTAYDPPRAVPLAALPLSSSTWGSQTPAAPPSPSGTPSPSPGSPSPSASAPASVTLPPSAAEPKSSPPPRRAAAGESEDVKGYTVSGGRVVFDLGATSAELVSATPAGGWRMQVWKQDYWIRVTFTRDGREASVFCTWYNEAPRVQVDER
ncbi:hypothetical protein ABZ934_11005 [Streptomyces sp. NPDC046557]|uniref:hypothetical protein n=1 Tax=Streptomyces sp. NPDC046557 TaxID=3155372 RepID=UPI003407B81D